MGEAYLEEQLSSIARQTHLPDELVIVDDASVDGTMRIAEMFAEESDFPVRAYQNPQNLGFIRNFQKAIEYCGGDVIVLADQDDVWRDDRISTLLANFADRPATTAVFSDAELVDASLHPLGYLLSDAIGFSAAERLRAADGQTFEVLMRGNVATGATMAFRAEYRDLILPLQDEIEHDAWIALLLSAVGEMRFISEPLIRYRQHGGNQIGATRLALPQRVARARADRVSGLARRRMRDRKALARLAAYPVPAARVRMLEEAAEHLEVRATLAEAWWRRIIPISRELVSGRYHQYSRGMPSVWRDLLV